MDRSNKKLKISYKCPTANTSAIWQHAAHTTDHLLLLAAKQEPFKTAYLLTKNIEDFSRKNNQENGPAGKKKKRSSRTRQQNKRGDIVEWNQMTALRFLTGGERHLTSPASLCGGYCSLTDTCLVWARLESTNKFFFKPQKSCFRKAKSTQRLRKNKNTQTNKTKQKKRFWIRQNKTDLFWIFFPVRRQSTPFKIFFPRKVQEEKKWMAAFFAVCLCSMLHLTGNRLYRLLVRNSLSGIERKILTG